MRPGRQKSYGKGLSPGWNKARGKKAKKADRQAVRRELVLVDDADLDEFYRRLDEQTVQFGRSNPAGVPWWGIGLVAAGASGWFYWRTAQRSKLAQLIQSSGSYQSAWSQGFVNWTPPEKAAEVVTFTNTIGADQAFALVLAELRLLVPSDPADLVNLTDDAKRLFEEKTGVNADAVIAAGSASAHSLYDKLPDVPGVDTSGWFSSLFGSKG